MHKYLWLGTTIVFLERMNLKEEEERPTPTDLRCRWSSWGPTDLRHRCSSWGHSCACRLHPALSPPLPYGNSSGTIWLLPFFPFSIVKSVMALFPLTLASWEAKRAFVNLPHLFLIIFLNAFHCFTNWLLLTLYIIKRIEFVESAPLEEFKNSYTCHSSPFYS